MVTALETSCLAPAVPALPLPASFSQPSMVSRACEAEASISDDCATMPPRTKAITSTATATSPSRISGGAADARHPAPLEGGHARRRHGRDHPAGDDRDHDRGGEAEDPDESHEQDGDAHEEPGLDPQPPQPHRRLEEVGELLTVDGGLRVVRVGLRGLAGGRGRRGVPVSPPAAEAHRVTVRVGIAAATLPAATPVRVSPADRREASAGASAPPPRCARRRRASGRGSGRGSSR